MRNYGGGVAEALGQVPALIRHDPTNLSSLSPIKEAWSKNQTTQDPNAYIDDRPIRPKKDESQILRDDNKSSSPRKDIKPQTQFLKRKKVYDPWESIKQNTSSDTTAPKPETRRKQG